MYHWFKALCLIFLFLWNSNDVCFCCCRSQKMAAQCLVFRGFSDINSCRNLGSGKMWWNLCTSIVRYVCIIVLACTLYIRKDKKGWDISSSLSRSALKSYSFYLKRHLDLQIKFSSMLLQLRLHLENSAAVQNAIFPRIPLFILIQVYFGSFWILLLLKTSIAIEFMHDRFMVV